MTVVIKSKSDLVVPRSVRRRAGMKSGDHIEFKVSGGVIKGAIEEAECCPAIQRFSMKVEYSDAVKEALDDAPAAVRKAFFKQIRLLEQNLRHPSLQAKKYDESKSRWQARANKAWRFISRSLMIPTTSSN